MENEITIYELKPIYHNNYIGQTVESADKNIWTKEDLISKCPYIKQYAVFKCTKIK